MASSNGPWSLVGSTLFHRGVEPHHLVTIALVHQLVGKLAELIIDSFCCTYIYIYICCWYCAIISPILGNKQKMKLI